MALSSNLYALKGQRLEKILGQKSGSKSSRMTRLLQFWQGHPKPAFSEKVQRGDQEKFFKNGAKSSHRLQNCPNGQVRTIFARSLKTRIFLKKCKKGTNRNFLKIAQKDALALKSQKHSSCLLYTSPSPRD